MNTNPQAFPRPYESIPGMDLRDYFAARCPEIEIGSVTVGDILEFKGLKRNEGMDRIKPEWWQEWRCAQRYAYADAMLAARAQTPPQP
jgi:hypothetical protein